MLEQKTDIWEVWTKRLFFLSFVLLGVTFTLQGIGVLEFPEWGEAKQKPIRAGGLRCDEPVWDFGPVDSIRTPRLTHEFVLVNESKETITIQKVHSDCGCMVAEGYDKELPPGGSTRLRADVDLPSLPSLFSRNLAVQTNKGVLPLRVVGEIAANNSMYCVPARVNFGVIRQGETKERIVHILRYDLSPVDFSDTSTTIAGVSCIPENFEHKTTLLISLSESELLPVGRFEDYLIIRTKDELNPTLAVPIFGQKSVSDVDDGE